MARFCTQCGVEASANFRFCGECGAKIPESAAPPTNSFPPKPVSRPEPIPTNNRPTFGGGLPPSRPNFPPPAEPVNNSRPPRPVYGTPPPPNPRPPEMESSYNNNYNNNYQPNRPNFPPPAEPPAPPVNSYANNRPVARPTFPHNNNEIPPAPIPYRQETRMTTPIVNREDPPPVTVGSAPTPSVAKPSGGGRGKTAEQLKEEEFFKNHTKEKQLSEIEKKKAREIELQATTDPWTCPMSIAFKNFSIVNKSSGKPDFVRYEIDVHMAGQNWTIFRRYGIMRTMDLFFRRDLGSSWPHKIPPTSGDKKKKYDPAFHTERLKALDAYFKQVVSSRQVFSKSKAAASHFVRFIVPTQLGDLKEINCMMPVRIDLY